MRRRGQRRQALSPETSYCEHPAFEDQSTHCSDPGLASRHRCGRSRTLRTEIRQRGPARTVWAHGHKKSGVRLATVPARSRTSRRRSSRYSMWTPGARRRETTAEGLARSISSGRPRGNGSAGELAIGWGFARRVSSSGIQDRRDPIPRRCNQSAGCVRFQVGDQVLVADVQPFDRLGMPPVCNDPLIVGEPPRDMVRTLAPEEREAVQPAREARRRVGRGCKRSPGRLARAGRSSRGIECCPAICRRRERLKRGANASSRSR